MGWAKKSLTAALIGISTIVTVIATLGFVPDVWLCDLASQLRLIYAAIFFVCLIALALLRSRIGIAIGLLGSLLNISPIASLYLHNQQVTAKHQKTICILNFNSEFQHNNRFDLFKTLIAQRDPDVIALVETNKKWIDAIEPATRRYPHRQVFIIGPGMALFSKFPIEKCEARCFGRSHHPRICATLQVDEQPVQLLIAHPTTPKSEYGYRERNHEMSMLGQEMATLASPKILVGDLNCGPWSAAFSDLLTAGLQDSEQGLGPQPTWPARTGRVFNEMPIPPLVPIDHILVSKDIGVINRTTGPAIGSDHLPVFIRLALPKWSVRKITQSSNSKS